jgi:O-antigen/teichoic acid export membrane protein
VNQARESHIGLIVKNAGIDTIGTAFNLVVMFAASVVITRTIGADLFGRFQISQSVFQVLGVFAVFGLNTGMVRLTSKYIARKESSSVKGTLISGMLISAGLSAGLVLLVMAFAPMIGHRAFPNVEGIDLVIRVQILGLPFFALMMVLNGYSQGLKTLKYSVLVELVSRPVIRLAAIVVLFLLGLRLFGVVFGAVSSYIAATLMAFYFARKISPFDYKTTRTHLVTRELFFYSLPLVFARFMNTLITKSNTLMVGFFRDATSTGLFGVAVILSPFISLSLTSFGKIFAPVISELWERGELNELEATFKTVTKWIFSLGLPVFLVFMLFPTVVLRIFGGGFPEASTTLRLLSMGEMVNAAVGPIGFILSMTGRQKLNLVNSIVLAGLNIALNVIMIPKYGIAGAGLATAISLGLLNIVRVVQVKILYGFTPFRKDLYKPLLAGAATFVVFYFLKSRLVWEALLPNLALCVAFAGLYFVLLYMLGLKEEKEVLFEILRRRK